VNGLSHRKDGKIVHNPEREMISDMDSLPWVTDVYKRDLQIEKYSIGYLKDRMCRFTPGAAAGAMHVLPVAADDRRAQVPRPFGGQRGGGDGPRQKTVPAGAGILLR